MWMVNPKIMCRKHLLGEHVEIHMLLGSLKRGKSIKGFLNTGLLEPKSIYIRHKDLVNEMKSRGYNHKSDLDIININKYGYVDKDKSLNDLLNRCEDCRRMYERQIKET
jgi:hypothetical protein